MRLIINILMIKMKGKFYRVKASIYKGRNGKRVQHGKEYTMRPATAEELDSIQKYIHSISHTTGENFWNELIGKSSSGEYVNRSKVLEIIERVCETHCLNEEKECDECVLGATMKEIEVLPTYIMPEQRHCSDGEFVELHSITNKI